MLTSQGSKQTLGTLVREIHKTTLSNLAPRLTVGLNNTTSASFDISQYNSGSLFVRRAISLFFVGNNALTHFLFASVLDFTEADPSTATERPPLRLVLKTEGSSSYGQEYTTSLPLTPDSTREILDVINTC